jgi:hypothetical protein
LGGALRDAEVKVMATGSSHTLFILKDGTTLATGLNHYGQLGDGSVISRNVPVPLWQVLPLNLFIAISAGVSHSLFLGHDFSAWAVGGNYNGQLGDGTNVDSTTPVKIMDGCDDVSAGYYYSVFLKRDGSVWATGKNEYGQLGDGTIVTKYTPVKVLEEVRQISAGEHHTLFLMFDGTVMSTGHNLHGQLGNGEIDLSTKKPVRGFGHLFGHTSTTTTTQTLSTWNGGSDYSGRRRTVYKVVTQVQEAPACAGTACSAAGQQSDDASYMGAIIALSVIGVTCLCGGCAFFHANRIGYFVRKRLRTVQPAVEYLEEEETIDDDAVGPLDVKAAGLTWRVMKYEPSELGSEANASQSLEKPSPKKRAEKKSSLQKKQPQQQLQQQPEAHQVKKPSEQKTIINLPQERPRGGPPTKTSPSKLPQDWSVQAATNPNGPGPSLDAYEGGVHAPGRLFHNQYASPEPASDPHQYAQHDPVSYVQHDPASYAQQYAQHDPASFSQQYAQHDPASYAQHAPTSYAPQ